MPEVQTESLEQKFEKQPPRRGKYPPLRKLSAKEQEIVLENRGLVYSAASYTASMMARFYHGSPHQTVRLQQQLFDDIYDSGLIGLCIAVQRFDPSLNFQFSTYAVPYVRSFVNRAAQSARITSTSSKSSFGKAAFLFSELGKVKNKYEDDPFDVPDTRCQEEEYSSDLPKEIVTLMSLILNEREMRFVRLHVIDGWTFRRISVGSGITKTRVEQVFSRAIEKLRECSGFIRTLEAENDREHKRREVLATGLSSLLA